jgi:cation transport regulator ChaB
MDIFDKYKSKRIFKSLALIDFFKDEMWQEDLIAVLTECFERSVNYEDALGNLEGILNEKGLKAFRTRYAKYKSAHKRRTDKKIVEVSQDILEQMTRLMAASGAETYDELFERLLDKTDVKISNILLTLPNHAGFNILFNNLPKEMQTQFSLKLESVYTKGFADGVNAIPHDLRKKQHIEENVNKALDENIGRFRQELLADE